MPTELSCGCLVLFVFSIKINNGFSPMKLVVCSRPNAAPESRQKVLIKLLFVGNFKKENKIVNEITKLFHRINLFNLFLGNKHFLCSLIWHLLPFVLLIYLGFSHLISFNKFCSHCRLLNFLISCNFVCKCKSAIREIL